MTFDGPDLPAVADLWRHDARRRDRAAGRHPVACGVLRLHARLGLPVRAARGVGGAAAGRRRGRRCRPDRSAWPTGTPASTRPRRPAAGGWSAGPTSRCSTPDRTPPALLDPGHPGAPGTSTGTEAMIAVVKPGLLTTVQDLGRPGYAHLGVARSGALDAAGADPGQPPRRQPRRRRRPGDHAHRGVAAGRDRPSTVAVTGALAPVTVDGQPVEFDTAVAGPGRRAVRDRPGRPSAYGPTWPLAAASPSRRCSAAARPTPCPGSGRRRCGPATCCPSARRRPPPPSRPRVAFPPSDVRARRGASCGSGWARGTTGSAPPPATRSSPRRTRSP